MSTALSVNGRTDDPHTALQALSRELHPAARDQIIALTESVRVSTAQLGNAVINIVIAIEKLRELIPDTSTFHTYCKNAFGYSKSSILRYLSIARLVRAKFTNEDGSIPMFVRNLPLNVMQLLGAETNLSDGVVHAIEEAARKGRVTKNEVLQILTQLRTEAHTRIEEQSNQILDLQGTSENLRAQLSETQRELYRETARADRVERELQDRHKTLLRKEDEIAAYLRDLEKVEADLQALRAKPPLAQREPQIIVQVPDDYASLEAAISAALVRRDIIQAELASLHDAQKAEREALAALRQTRERTATAAQTVARLKEEIESIALKIPAAVVNAVALGAPQARDSVSDLACTLRTLADLLASIGAESRA